MPSSIFEFFELVADEFEGRDEVFFGINRMQDPSGLSTPLLLALRTELRSQSDARVIPDAISALQAHFSDKSLVLPFKYDPRTTRFFDPNENFLAFVRTCKELRSLSVRAQEFELTILQRLAERLDGELHRVGFPRQRLKTIKEANAHLREHFHFKNDILAGNEKDGGLDILWKLPLGTNPFVPIVAIQCKNGHFTRPDADSSLVTCRASQTRHGWLHKEVHVNCVVFNDYISPKLLYPKGAEYIPIGISDLMRDRQATVMSAI